MDLGTSILGSATGVSAIFGTVTIIIKLIGVKQSKPASTENNGNGNGKCPVHGDVEQRFRDGDKEMKEMREEIKEIREDTTVTRQAVIAIASRLKIPLDAIEKEMKEMVK
ncbi:MAG: hypothetical protein A4E65_02437 [Syntrophorhabdus sp. PtaU1.Bin153]|nr:MAG: hypothetical protein A4E65_02437 [Syntrophorhabdus sp. PtaU1.Bin153]